MAVLTPLLRQLPRTLASVANVLPYATQSRGDEAAYDTYLEQMDGSMRAKVAVAAAHILSEGNVADMGMGSGSGSYALAACYPHLKVTGIDIDPELVKRATEKYTLRNLTFAIGDIAKKCLSSPQDAILDSSVLHHVTSYNGYNPFLVQMALENQKEMLADYGVIIVRDFVSPGNDSVFLDIPENSSDIPLFLRFTKEFRSLHTTPGCPYSEVEGPPGFRRFSLTHKHAVEFVLRKDYVEDWDVEIQEEYTYATPKEFQRMFRELSFRILSSIPIRNPWIIQNRFDGKFILRDTKGKELDPPATNYIIVGQKVPRSEGVDIRAEAPIEDFHYLERAHYERVDTGQIIDLVRRPGSTLDVIPWYLQDDRFYILARREYPRPIVGEAKSPSLDGSTPSVYITEPLNVQRLLKPTAQTIEETLEHYGEIKIEHFDEGIRFFPSPGGIQEEVISKLVRIRATTVSHPLENISGFSTSGIVRSIEGEQLLRAAQVGAIRDIRLELNVRKLFQIHGRSFGPWIGEAITLENHPLPEAKDFLPDLESRRLFRSTRESADFLEIKSAEFVERSSLGLELHKKLLQWVVPTRYSNNTIAVAVLRRHRDEIFIGIDDDDRPAMQSFDGHSNIFVAPAWRVPKKVGGIRASRQFIQDRLSQEYNLSTHKIWELGGSYHSSPGVTPELVTPLAIEAIEKSGDRISRITWVPLIQLLKNQDQILDGHLRIVALRAAHALGVFVK